MTPSPFSSIVPRYSWPRMNPSSSSIRPLVGVQVGAADRRPVDPQQHVGGLPIEGFGTSSTRTSRGPQKITACIVAMAATLSEAR